LPGSAAFIYVTSVAQVAGGIAIQFRKTERLGALTLGIVYLLFSLTWVARIAAQPLVYDRWANAFERLALVAGAMVAYGAASPSVPYAKHICRAGMTLFGICVVSFMLEQAVHLGATAELVPKWLPPSQMFWAVATTIAFALAAFSILSRSKALLASRLLTLMLLIFGTTIWIPTLIADPSNHANWGETLETFAIAGSAWVLADFLGRESTRQNLGTRGRPVSLGRAQSSSS
jgi:hypothetical protein